MAWEYDMIANEFGTSGCRIVDCPYHNAGNVLLACALNLSDAILTAGYTLPAAANVNYCPHCRVRNADGMARVVRAALGGPHASGWSRRPTWKGIVYFEDGPQLADVTGHIDLWDGTKAVHASYSSASVVWFFKTPG
jgi:Type VI secretion system (T6SS), amidase effector protein 4